MNTRFNFILLLIAIVSINSCSKDSSSESVSPGSNTGTGGSMAKYTIMNNYLYTVEGANLKIYDVTVASTPKFLKQISLKQNDIETIFANAGYLFFGTRSGMLIYSISNATTPVYISKYQHVISCDPVVVDSRYAYVTLSRSSTCTRGVSVLEIIDISDITAPNLVKSYDFKNPKGMAIDGNYLYLCDSDAGLKVLDISKTPIVTVVNEIKSIDTYDVIAKDDILTITGNYGLYQYDCKDPLNLKFISKINK